MLCIDSHVEIGRRRCSRRLEAPLVLKAESRVAHSLILEVWWTLCRSGVAAPFFYMQHAGMSGNGSVSVLEFCAFFVCVLPFRIIPVCQLEIGYSSRNGLQCDSYESRGLVW